MSREEAYDAYCAMLAQSDPPDLPARTHVRTQAGVPPHKRQAIKAQLHQRWLQHRLHESRACDGVISVITREGASVVRHLRRRRG